MRLVYGRVAEWPNASVLKTEDGQPSGGSNPSSSDCLANGRGGVRTPGSTRSEAREMLFQRKSYPKTITVDKKVEGKTD